MAYFQYTVKYLCGQSEGDILGRGSYRTAINIHNPYDFRQVPICWKVVSPKPGGSPTPPGPWKIVAGESPGLGPDEGMEINCRLLDQFIAGSLTGFVVIRSPNELDVVAVYTVERLDQPAVVHVDIQNIAPRIIQTDREMCHG